MRLLRSLLALSVALGPLAPALTAQAAPAARPTRQFTSVTVDGTIGTGEYGDHTNGQNRGDSGSQAWYMTWDDTNLYVAVDVANRTEAAVIYIDANPLTPVNGGSNTNGNLTGQAYDSTNFGALPFRADFVTFVKHDYREYRTANGSGAWSGPTSGFGSYADDGSDTREVAIPWSAITGVGRPASFAWFGYVTSSGGFVYAPVPTGNPAGSIGTAAVAPRSFLVSSTVNGASTKPFAQNIRPFTPGNLVVYRVGSGSGTLVNTGNPVFLDEFTPAGTLVQSIALPTVATGTNKALVASGTATSEGFLTRSADGQFIIVTGYSSTIPAAGNLSGTSVPRTIGRVDANGLVDTSTALTDFASGNNPRSATSMDGSTLWAVGGAGGVRFAALGAVTSTQINTDTVNLRVLNITDGQLYVSTVSGSSVRIGSVGTGLPTTAGQTLTSLPGFPTSGGGPYAFAFGDLDSGVSGMDTLYVADDTALALTKYSLVSGSWTANGTVGLDADDFRGLTAVISGTTATLFATRTGNQLVTRADSSGYNGAFSGSFTTLYTTTTNTALRGVALAPVPATPVADLGLSKTGPASAWAGDTLTYTLALSNSGNTPASATLLTDTLPAGVNFITYTASAPATFNQSGAVLTWDFGTLNNASAIALTLTASAAVTFTSAATLTNTAQTSTSTNETVLGNNSAQASTLITPLLADLQIAASAPAVLTIGEALTYTLAVSNTGLTGTTGIEVVVALDPATYDFAAASGTGGFSAVHTSGLVTFTGDLTLNDLETLTVVITPTATGTYTGSASIDPANAVIESNESNNTADPVVSNVNALAADLVVNVSDAPDPVTVGDRLTYALEVSNLGGTAALSVTLAFTLPAQPFDFAEAVGAWGSGTLVGNLITFTGDIAANNSLFINVAITPTTSGVYTTGIALVDALNVIAESNETNNTSEAVTTTVNPVFPDLTVSVTDAPDPVVVNDTLTYTLLAANLGAAPASTVDLTFALPANAVFVSTTSMGGFSAVQVGGVVTFSAPTLAAGAVATLTVSVVPTATGTLTGGPAVIDPQNTVTESDESNNTAAAVTTTVLAAWDGAGTAGIINGAGPAQGFTIFQRNLSSTVQVTLTGVVTGPLGQASLTFPMGWDLSAASPSLSGPGLSSGSAVIVGQVVSLTGLALTNVNTGTLTLVGVTTPNPTALTDDGIYTPTVRTARANGTLTAMASQPRVNVTVPITNLRDTDANVLPLDSGKVVAIEGVNTALTTFGTNQLSVFVQDDTSGYGVFNSNAAFVSRMSYGNRYIVRGTVGHFNGAFQLSPATDIITTEIGAAVPAPVTYTLQQLRTFSETLEGTLVRVISATKVSGTWPGTGSNADIFITDPTGFTLTMRIDLDTNIDGSSEPSYPIELVGIFTQFDGSNPRDSGYQILPRATSDITSTGAPPPVVVTVTNVYSLQGAGPVSPFSGTIVTTLGEVVGDFQGSSGQNGFYIQDVAGDGNPLTSDGLFVFIPAANPFSTTVVNVGDFVTVTGRVVEFGTTTQLDLVSALTVTAGSPTLTPTIVTLPEATNGDLERYEGMLIHIPHSMTVQQNYFLGRYGQLTLASGGRLYQPTNVITPGAPANALADANLRRLIILDDAWTGQNPATVPYLAGDNTIRAGDTITGLTGVLDAGVINPNGATEYRLQPTLPLTSYVFTRANPRTLAPDPVAGDNLTVGSFNVLNYFNGNGAGGGFPTSRGASNLAEFERQNQKIITAVLALDADVLGLMEIENDGATSRPALNELVDRINAVAGSTVYTYVETGVVGSDEIRVAFIYKPAVVTPLGAAITDSNPVYSRPPVAQTFTHNGSGETFTAIVNHFKSKGGCPTSGPDADQGDGQGCFNATRVLQAQALITFAASLAATDPDIIIIGDLNAYAQEDPITTLRNAGFVDMLDTFEADPYSYVFDGQSGYLDHALASASFMAQAVDAQEWHINADEPLVLDYNTEFNPPALFFPDAFRSSDHDPVLTHFFITNVPLNPAVVLTKTVSTDLCVSQSDVLTVTAGATVNYCITVQNTGNVTLTTHTLVDPMLEVNTTFPLTLTPGMVVGPLPFTYTVGIGGIFTNTATFTATNGTDTASDSDSAVLVVLPPFIPNPAVVLTKTVSADLCASQGEVLTVTAGAVVNYCITVQNTGNVTLTTHTLVDPMLDVNTTFPLTLTPGMVVGPLPFTYTASMAGTFTNTATFTATDGVNTASASDSAVLVVEPAFVPAPSIAFTKTVSVDGCATQANTLTVTVGTAVRYCFTWTNTGNVTFTNHVLTDTALGPNQLFTLLLAPGETFGPFEIAYTPALTGTTPVTLVNTATFSSTNGTYSASASDSATLVILPRYLFLPLIQR